MHPIMAKTISMNEPGMHPIMAKNMPAKPCTTGIPESLVKADNTPATLYNRDPKKGHHAVHVCVCVCVSNSSPATLFQAVLPCCCCCHKAVTACVLSTTCSPTNKLATAEQQQVHTYGLQEHTVLELQQSHAPQMFQSLPNQHPSTCTTPQCKLLVLPAYIACLH